MKTKSKKVSIKSNLMGSINNLNSCANPNPNNNNNTQVIQHSTYLSDEDMMQEEYEREKCYYENGLKKSQYSYENSKDNYQASSNQKSRNGGFLFLLSRFMLIIFNYLKFFLNLRVKRLS